MQVADPDKPKADRSRLALAWAKRDYTEYRLSKSTPFVAMQLRNVNRTHWVVRLLLVSATREFLVLLYDPLLRNVQFVKHNFEEGVLLHHVRRCEGFSQQKDLCPVVKDLITPFIDGFGDVANSLIPCLRPLLDIMVWQEDYHNCGVCALLMMYHIMGLNKQKRVCNEAVDRLFILQQMVAAIKKYLE